MKARSIVTAVTAGLVGFHSVPALGETSSPAQAPAGPRSWVLQEAPLNEAVSYTNAQLAGIFREMSHEDNSVRRLLEGGEFNVNIRHVANMNPDNYRIELHDDTIDVWVVQQGSGTLVTGGEMTGDKHSGGDERYISVGDLVFIPAGLPHGIKETVGITWFNIRFPEHRN